MLIFGEEVHYHLKDAASFLVFCSMHGTYSKAIILQYACLLASDATHI